MISTITKQSTRVKKKEWAIYHNIGVQHDAERFSLIDTVLDGELNDYAEVKQKVSASSKTTVLNKAGKWLKTQMGNRIFRTYLFCWFSLYCGVTIIGKLVR